MKRVINAASIVVVACAVLLTASVVRHRRDVRYQDCLACQQYGDPSSPSEWFWYFWYGCDQPVAPDDPCRQN